MFLPILDKYVRPHKAAGPATLCRRVLGSPIWDHFIYVLFGEAIVHYATVCKNTRLDNRRKVGVVKLKINVHFGFFIGRVEVGEDVIAFCLVLSLIAFAGQRRYVTRFHMFVRLVVHLYFMSGDLIHLPATEEHDNCMRHVMTASKLSQQYRLLHSRIDNYLGRKFDICSRKANSRHGDRSLTSRMRAGGKWPQSKQMSTMTSTPPDHPCIRAQGILDQADHSIEYTDAKRICRS